MWPMHPHEQKIVPYLSKMDGEEWDKEMKINKTCIKLKRTNNFSKKWWILLLLPPHYVLIPPFASQDFTFLCFIFNISGSCKSSSNFQLLNALKLQPNLPMVVVFSLSNMVLVFSLRESSTSSLLVVYQRKSYLPKESSKS